MSLKIEIRSPITIDKTPDIAGLLETVKAATEEDLAPKIKFAERVRQRLAKKMAATAKTLMEAN